MLNMGKEKVLLDKKDFAFTAGFLSYYIEKRKFDMSLDKRTSQVEGIYTSLTKKQIYEDFVKLYEANIYTANAFAVVIDNKNHYEDFVKGYALASVVSQNKQEEKLTISKIYSFIQTIDNNAWENKNTFPIIRNYQIPIEYYYRTKCLETVNSLNIDVSLKNYKDTDTIKEELETGTIDELTSKLLKEKYGTDNITEINTRTNKEIEQDEEEIDL